MLGRSFCNDVVSIDVAVIAGAGVKGCQSLLAIFLTIVFSLSAWLRNFQNLLVCIQAIVAFAAANSA